MWPRRQRYRGNYTQALCEIFYYRASAIFHELSGTIIAMNYH